MFPEASCFVIPTNSKLENRNRLLYAAGSHKFAAVSRCRTQSRESLKFMLLLVSCVRRGENFNPRHLTRFPPIGKSI